VVDWVRVVVVLVRVVSVEVRVLEVAVVVVAAAHADAPVQALKSFVGAKMAAPPKEQPRTGSDVSPCLAK